MKCIVIDDESLAVRILSDYIGKIPILELAGTFDNPLKAISLLAGGNTDLIFLDIEMPGLTGIDFLRTLRDGPLVILTTAYSRYAIDSYDFDVVDYLLKPVSFERFLRAVNKAAERHRMKASQPVSEFAQITRADGDHFFVKSDSRLVKVLFSEILYIEGLREYVSIYTDNQRIITLQSLRHLEEILPKGRFLRTHKSYIVSMEKIRAVEGNMIEIGKVSVPVGKSYKDVVLRELNII